MYGSMAETGHIGQKCDDEQSGAEFEAKMENVIGIEGE